MDSFALQNSIRSQASGLQSYMKDLQEWQTDMQQKDSQMRSTKRESSRFESDMPIRNRAQSAEMAFDKLKTKGNQQYKNGEFKNAIMSYSKALEIAQTDSQKSVLFSNRAMARLKCNEWQLAENDCTQCLSLDSNNTKAFYRRGCARRELRNYTSAIEDFETVLRLNPSNAAASNALSSLRRKQSSKLRRVPIIECLHDSDSDTDDERKDNRNDNSTEDKPKPVNPNPSLNIPNHSITDFISFHKTWHSCQTSANVQSFRSSVLQSIVDRNWKQIFANMIDEQLFSQLIQTIDFVSNTDLKMTIQLVTKLSTVDRFDMLVLFLDESILQIIRNLKKKCEKLISNKRIDPFDCYLNH